MQHEPIPGLDLSGVYPGAMLAVEVAEVRSPSHFWLKRLGADHAGALCSQEVVLETLLVDTSGEDDVLLSTELVRAGYADERAGSAQGSGESYLLPRWEPLEAGDTLSLDEVHRYLAAGIELDSVQAYSRHVASALPPPKLALPEQPPPGLPPPKLALPELPLPELTPPPSPSLLKI